MRLLAKMIPGYEPEDGRLSIGVTIGRIEGLILQYDEGVIPFDEALRLIAETVAAYQKARLIEWQLNRKMTE
jgi:hypothetical protein